MEFVPIQSYHKATVAALYNNEGEVKWDIRTLKNAINKNTDLLSILKANGYKEKNKSFTAFQVELIFKHLSTPILNDKNMRLLKIEPKPEFDLLKYQGMHLGELTLKPLDELKDGVLFDLGIIKNKDKPGNYLFRYNPKICLKRTLTGFEFYDTETLESIRVVNDTKGFIVELQKLRND